MGRYCRCVSLKDLGYKPRTRGVRIIFDDPVRAELEDARTALKRWLGRPDQTLSADHEKRVEEAETAAEKAAVLFTFRALPRHRVADMIAQCPPTVEQLDRWKDALRAAPLVNRSAPAFDIDKLTPLLIGASIIEPAATESDIQDMWERGDWSDAIWTALWDAAWDVNEVAFTLPT